MREQLLSWSDHQHDHNDDDHLNNVHHHEMIIFTVIIMNIITGRTSTKWRLNKLDLRPSLSLPLLALVIPSMCFHCHHHHNYHHPHDCHHDYLHHL